MKTLLMPVFKERISSRLDCTECFQVVEIDNNSVYRTEKVKVISKNQLEKLNLILSLKPNIVICNGLTEYYENEFHKNHVKVISWVHGKFEDVIKDFINGNLNSNI